MLDLLIIICRVEIGSLNLQRERKNNCLTLNQANMKQTKSIASFIEQLPMDGSVGDCESALLVSNMDYTGGGGSNGGNCINTVNCEETTNTGECIMFLTILRRR